jgi:hypothetical protein
MHLSRGNGQRYLSEDFSIDNTAHSAVESAVFGAAPHACVRWFGWSGMAHDFRLWPPDLVATEPPARAVAAQNSNLGNLAVRDRPKPFKRR